MYLFPAESNLTTTITDNSNHPKPLHIIPSTLLPGEAIRNNIKPIYRSPPPTKCVYNVGNEYRFPPPMFHKNNTITNNLHINPHPPKTRRNTSRKKVLSAYRAVS